MNINIAIRDIAYTFSRNIKSSDIPIGAFISWYPSESLEKYPKVRTFVIYYLNGHRRECRLNDERYPQTKNSLNELGSYIKMLDMYYDFRRIK